MVARNSLPRALSLKSRAEIAELLDSGRRIATKWFTLVWQPAEQFRYAVFVSRRFGTAVDRNRVKRRFREAIRLSRKNLMAPCRIAFMPRRRPQEPKLAELVTDVTGVFERLNREITTDV